MEDEGVELIFVSCDRSKADMISYMKVSGAQIFPQGRKWLPKTEGASSNAARRHTMGQGFPKCKETTSHSECYQF